LPPSEKISEVLDLGSMAAITFIKKVIFWPWGRCRRGMSRLRTTPRRHHAANNSGAYLGDHKRTSTGLRARVARGAGEEPFGLRRPNLGRRRPAAAVEPLATTRASRPSSHLLCPALQNPSHHPVHGGKGKEGGSRRPPAGCALGTRGGKGRK
jgi:hypothetical protein